MQEQADAWLNSQLLVMIEQAKRAVAAGRIKEGRNVVAALSDVVSKSTLPAVQFHYCGLKFQIALAEEKFKDAKDLATELLEDAYRWWALDPSDVADSAVADAHLSVGHAAMRLHAFKEARQCFAEALRIALHPRKPELIKLALESLALIELMKPGHGSNRAAALLLVREELIYQHGLPTEYSMGAIADARLPALLSSAESIAAARRVIEQTSPQLVPYYESALDRHGVYFNRPKPN